MNFTYFVKRTSILSVFREDFLEGKLKRIYNVKAYALQYEDTDP